MQWLNNDLRSTTAKCTLAYWHHPLFTSGPSAGSNAMMRDVWTLLYGQNVDIVVNGHDHFYERFFPQDFNGVRGTTGGITEYIVGTGGTPLYDFSAAAAEQRGQGQELRRALPHAARDGLGLGLHRGRHREPPRLQSTALCH